MTIDDVRLFFLQKSLKVDEQFWLLEGIGAVQVHGTDRKSPGTGFRNNGSIRQGKNKNLMPLLLQQPALKKSVPGRGIEPAYVDDLDNFHAGNLNKVSGAAGKKIH